MNFKESLERMKKGAASPEETREVEAEIEKYEAIGDYLAERFDALLPAPQGEGDPAAVKRLSRRVGWRMFRNSLLALLLAAALTALGVAGCNLYYYNPNRGIQPVYSGDGQLMIDLSAFAELHFPGYTVNWAEARRDGPGSYQIQLQMGNLFAGSSQTTTERIVRNRALGSGSAVRDYWKFPVANAFGYRAGTLSWVDENGGEHHSSDPGELERQRAALEELPASCQAEAYVTFSKDLTLEEFSQLYGQYGREQPDLYFAYAAVTSADRYMRSTLGFRPSFSGMILENLPEEQYPLLGLGNHEEELEQDRVKAWETHFRSLLGYMADRPEFIRAMFEVNSISENYYRETLSYIDENGVNIYGALIQGSRDDILRFLEEESLRDFYVSDVRLSVLERR